jgi:uncharacterized protein (TIGR02302 family)
MTAAAPLPAGPRADADRPAPGLAARRTLARVVLLLEALWPALWPAVGVAGLFVVVALLGLPGLLPPVAATALRLGTAAAVVWLALRGLRGLAWPDTAAAERRLERASGLAHRPLATLADRPATADPGALALWQAHRARAAAAVRQLRVGWPHPGLARRDRRGLRGGLVVALVAAFAIAGAHAPERLATALWPNGAAGAAPAPQLLAWITPPSYTGLAPVYLRPGAPPAPIPAGSRLAVSLAGGSGQPRMRLGNAAIAFRRLGTDGATAGAVLTASTRLVVWRGGQQLGAWALTVIADRPPTVAWAAPPGALRTDSLQTRLPWRTGDDYGVVGLKATLRLQGRSDAKPLVLPIPLPAEDGAPDGGSAASAQPGGTITRTGEQVVDLTANPWAGLPVLAQFEARDGAGQTGRSPVAGFVLPAPQFRNKVARALVAVRQMLSLAPDRRADAAGAIGALLTDTEAFGHEYGAWLELRLDAQRLLLPPEGTGARLDRVQHSLWLVAQRLEESGLDPSARALAKARRDVRDALDRALHTPNAANREALQQRLRELERAIDARLQALRRDFAREGAPLPNTASAQQRLQRLAEAARAAARQGDMQAAAARIAALQQLLDSLRNAKALAAEARRAYAARQQAQQALGALNELIRQEGRLLDHAHQRLQRAQTPAAPPGAESPDPDAQRAADATEQQALRQRLDQVMHRLEALAGQPAPGLGRARAAMGGARAALTAGEDTPAETAEQAAIAAMQKGGQALGQALAKRFGPGQPGGQPGETLGLSGPGQGETDPTWLPGLGDPGQDPLGRGEGPGGAQIDPRAEVLLPAHTPAGRTRQIEEELRRRQGQRTRPQEELEYIERLLKQF